MKTRHLLYLVCTLLAAANLVMAQGEGAPPDPYAAANKNLEKWLKDAGFTVHMRGPIAEGFNNVKGLEAIYDADFSFKGTEWRLRRYARTKGHGDILTVGWFNSKQKFREEGTVECGKNGIAQADVKKLLSHVK